MDSESEPDYEAFSSDEEDSLAPSDRNEDESNYESNEEVEVQSTSSNDNDNHQDEAKPTTISALIELHSDYDTLQVLEKDKRTYQINTAGGRTFMTVAYAGGKSTEFLMCETYEALDDVMTATPGGWPASRRFQELKFCLRGKARQAYDALVRQDYPTAADKTNANYIELKRKLITTLSDHTWPGNRVHYYLSIKAKYIEYKHKGSYVTPNQFLQRMERIRSLGAEMHHTMGPVYMADLQFKSSFWNSFPESMKSWLENDQDIDPFDTANPLDVQELADQLQRYYNKHLKSTPKTSKAQSKSKVDTDSNSDDDSTKQDSECDSEDDCEGKRHGIKNKHRTKNIKKTKSNCPIPGHDKYHHSWTGCFLNPHSWKFNPSSAEAFYHTDEAHGNSSWYRDVYEQMLYRQEQAPEQQYEDSHSMYNSHGYDDHYYAPQDNQAYWNSRY